MPEETAAAIPQPAQRSARVHSPKSARLDLDAVPGPPATPILGVYGNLLRFFLNNVRYMDMLQRDYGDIAMLARNMRSGLVISPNPAPGAVFLFGSKFIEQVLIKHASTQFPDAVIARLPEELGGAARLTGGLLWTSGEQHRQHRKLITPLYHQKTIQHYRDLIVAGIDAELNALTPLRPMDIIQVAGDLLVKFQDKVVLGVDENTLDGKLRGLGVRLVDFYRMISNPLSHVPLDLPFTPRRELRLAGDSLATDLDTLIRWKRSQKEPQSDVLSTMIHSRYEDGSSVPHEDLVAEALHLFISGWVSTRASMAWTSLLLAEHPQVAADLYAELDSELHGDAPTLEQLKRLPMLDCVVKESLRLFPPIPIVSRASREDAELGGYQLPARTELYLSIYHAHRQPEIFERPKRFIPERWRSIDPSPYEYLPFGVGSRTCLGLSLATMQLKLWLAMFVQRYRLEVPRGTTISAGGVGIMVPKPALQLIVHKQDRRFEQSRAPVRGTIHEMVELDA